MPTTKHMASYQRLRSDFRHWFDPGDKWGSVTNFRFAISEVLYHTDNEIPDEWEFGDSPMHPEGFAYWDDDDMVEDYIEQELFYSLLNGYISASDLIRFGKVLYRYSHLLEKAGKDY